MKIASPAHGDRKYPHPFRTSTSVTLLVIFASLLTACTSGFAQKPTVTRMGLENEATVTDTSIAPVKSPVSAATQTATQTPSATRSPEAPVDSNGVQPLSATPIETTSPPAQTPTGALCQLDLCSYSSPLFLHRPIDPPGNDTVDITYRFGSTQSGQRDPHHGVEFLNSLGTPVLAAGDGTVVVAGNDFDPISPRGAWPILYYGPYYNFYGNLIVIEHPLSAELKNDFPDLTGPFFTLYGHLSEIDVQVGQQVKTGQMIGKVGMTGIATGSHLHFEVRIGENSYKASRNPELWLIPHTDKNGQLNGAIAGRFLSAYNEYLEMPSIVLQHLPDGPEGPVDFEVTVTTYEEKSLIGQPPFQESFGIGDLAPGLYRLSFPMGGLRQELVTIFPGQLTVITFRSQ